MFIVPHGYYFSVISYEGNSFLAVVWFKPKLHLRSTVDQNLQFHHNFQISLVLAFLSLGSNK